jgi:hypothetical protein
MRPFSALTQCPDPVRWGRKVKISSYSVRGISHRGNGGKVMAPTRNSLSRAEVAMKISPLFIAALLFSIPTLASSQTTVDQGRVINITLQAINAGIGSYQSCIGTRDTLYRFRSGLSVDFNPSSRIFIRLNGNWYWGGTDNGGSLSGGVGYAIRKDYYPSRSYTNVFVSDQYLGGGWIERTTTIERGTCQSITAKTIEAGLERQFLNRSEEQFPTGNVYEVDQQEKMNDTVLYIGYRWANYYTMSIAMEAFTCYAHGLIGFKDRAIRTDSYAYAAGLTTTTSKDNSVAVGAEFGIDWYIVNASLQLYDDEFLFYCGFRIPLTFVFK